MDTNRALNRYQAKRAATRTAVSLVRFVFVCCVCYLFLFPLLYLLITSIQTPESLKDPSVVWIPRELTVDNFRRAAEMLDFGRSFGMTAVISVFGTLATLISCAMAGYALARFEFFEKRIAFLLVLILIIIPPQTTSMSVFLNFRFFDPLGLISLFEPLTEIDSLNLIGSPAAIILPAIFASGIRSGLSIFIFRQFFLGQPKELEEAAKIDGCGVFGTYTRIMLPLSSPAIITVSVFSFVWYWNDSFYSALFFTDDLKPLAAQIAVLRNTFLADAGNSLYSAQESKAILAAAGLLSIIAPLIVYLIIQKRFAESVERTGIVG